MFVSPGDAPGAITLNIVWMEREFDAYKLSRWMCPSDYNRFWDRARYWSKCRNCYFSYPLAFDAPVRGGFPSDYRYPVRHEKTRMAWLPDGEKLSKISLLVLTQLTNVTDTDTAWQHRPRVCIASLVCVNAHKCASDLLRRPLADTFLHVAIVPANAYQPTKFSTF